MADNRKRGGGTFVRISASTIIGKLSAPIYMCVCERERESNVSLILFFHPPLRFHPQISTTVTGAKSLVETNDHRRDVDEIKKEFPVGNEITTRLWKRGKWIKSGGAEKSLLSRKKRI